MRGSRIEFREAHPLASVPVAAPHPNPLPVTDGERGRVRELAVAAFDEEAQAPR